MRIFTYKEIVKLFEQSNFQIDEILPKFSGDKARIFNKLTMKMFDGFLAFQFLVIAKNQENDKSFNNSS